MERGDVSIGIQIQPLQELCCLRVIEFHVVVHQYERNKQDDKCEKRS
jgi:hypothetical protein